MSEDEVWKDIPGYEGIYKISSFGRIKALPKETHYGVSKMRVMPEKILKPDILTNTKSGEKTLSICLLKMGKRKRFTVKALVVRVFLGRQTKYGIGYLNGNYLDCSVKNLVIKNSCYTPKPKAKDIIPANKRFIGTNVYNGSVVEFNSLQEANCFCGVSKSDQDILKNCAGIKKEAHGYRWACC